jgi:hypothetical protein
MMIEVFGAPGSTCPVTAVKAITKLSTAYAVS